MRERRASSTGSTVVGGDDDGGRISPVVGVVEGRVKGALVARAVAEEGGAQDAGDQPQGQEQGEDGSGARAGTGRGAAAAGCVSGSGADGGGGRGWSASSSTVENVHASPVHHRRRVLDHGSAYQPGTPGVAPAGAVG